MKFNGNNRDAGTVAPSYFRRRRGELLCAALLVLMAANMISVIARKSITIDEWVMIPAGYYHLTAGDYRPVNEHPPFAKLLSAAPLLMTETKAPSIDSRQTHDYEYFLGLFQNFWRMNAAQIDYLTFWARLPLVAVTILLGALVFVFARRHWGERAALFAIALFALEPTILAHGRVVQTDIPSALAFLLFVFAFHEYLKAPNARRAAYVGLAAGLAAVTKFSMIVLGPVLALAFALLLALAPRRGLMRRAVLGQAAALTVAAVLAVNAAYLFHHRQPEALDDALARMVVPTRVGDRLHAPLEAGYYALQVIFPADFVSGIGWQLGHAQSGHPAGLLGQHGMKGWWYYFPVAFALKTPLPILLLAIASLLWGLWMLRRKIEGRLLVLLVPLALFTGLLMLNTINIGVRYYLPAYPLFFILSGAMLDDALRRSGRRRLAATVIASVLFCWVAVEAVRAYPDQMSYMNQLASRAPHWWYLSDSNVEWGDDIRDLALYLRQRGETKVGAAILEWQLLDIYGIEGAAIFVPPGEKPEDVRYVAIGASLLNGSTVPGGFDNGVELTKEQRVNYFDEFRRRAPEKIFGGSIYLYRMKE
ncbi:MAG: glycosyltransferase family 39 protein [Rubrivivax sp.]|nr:glycosyltransferase family 39 protein [Pyrinomonadaceae bacterium]